MQLICPSCGNPISAENVNIQQMSAICPACHTVFQFDVPTNTKVKKRKVKQPQNLSLHETASHKTIAFRTNFRLDKSEGFLSSAFFSVIFTFITAVLVDRYFTNQISGLIPLGFGLFTLGLYYSLALLAYNKTTIKVTDEKIEISRKPLPNFLTEPRTIGLSGIKTIYYEETPISKKEHYDTPRYNIWAETIDGHGKIIVSDIVEEYATFISQRLNEYLDMDITLDVAHLLDIEREANDLQEIDESITQSSYDF